MSKISELSDGGSLVSSDYLIAVRSGGNVKVRMDQINVDQVDLGDNEFIRLGNSQDLTMVHTSTQSIINQAGIGDLLIQKAGATKLTINASGIDVTGSVTTTGNVGIGGAPSAYNLDIYGAGGASMVVGSTTGRIFLYGDNTGTTLGSLSAIPMRFYTNGAEAMRIDGATGNVGIGAVPNQILTLDKASGDVFARFDKSGAIKGLIGVADSAGAGSSGSAQGDMIVRGQTRLLFDTAGTTALTIDNSRNVGIGTSSPDRLIDLRTAPAEDWQIRLGANNTDLDTYDIGRDASDGLLHFYGNQTGYTGYVFDGINGERMRIDSSGNLLVGRTSSSGLDVDGHVLFGGGGSYISNTDAGVQFVNRNGVDDGALTSYYKNGTPVGSIGSIGSDLYIAESTSGLRFDGENNQILPSSTTASTDGTCNLGAGSARFKDLYLSGFVRAGAGTAADPVLTGSDGNTGFFFPSGGVTAFTQNGVERGRWDASGNLLVGGALADVNGLVTNHLFEGASGVAGNGAVGVYNNTGTANAPALIVLNRDTSTDSTNRFVQFNADVTSSGSQAMGAIVGNGANNAQFAATSDVREKENITTISGSLSKINSLNPVEFDWITSGEHCKAGFVAQEVEEVFPEFVVENMASEGEEERKGLTGGMTGGIVAHLVKAIQEQQAIIESLEARIAALES